MGVTAHASNKWHDNCNDEYQLTTNDNKSKVPYVNFRKQLPEEFNNMCYCQILDIAKEFDAFIDERIISTEKLIKKSINIDKNIVDLI